MMEVAIANNSKQSSLKCDLFLLGIFFVLALSIILKSWFHIEGYLSPDSTGYLHLAQRILDGHGFTEIVFNEMSYETRHAAVWPFGYPLAICIVAKIFTCSVFWASKILNIFIVGIILIILRTLFKDRSYIYGLVLVTASSLEQFTYSLSEVPFILGMTLFAAALYSFFNKTDKLWIRALLLFSGGMIMFLSRYAGSFFLASLLVVFFYCLYKKEFIRSIYIGTVGLVSFGIISSYLYYNFLVTGFTSGMARIPSKESHIDLFVSILSAVFNEINVLRHSFDGYELMVLFLFTQLLILSIPIMKCRKELNVKKWIGSIKITGIMFIFCFVGFSYWASIIYVRWKYHFDPFSFRLLGPGTILIFIAVLSVVEEYASEEFKKLWFKSLCLLAFLSLLLNVPMKTYTQFQNNHLTYGDRIAKIENVFEKVNSNNIVLTWNRDLKYLRSDLIVLWPSTHMNNLESDKLAIFRKKITLIDKSMKVYFFEDQDYLSKQKIKNIEFTKVYNEDQNSLYEIKVKEVNRK